MKKERFLLLPNSEWSLQRHIRARFPSRLRVERLFQQHTGKSHSASNQIWLCSYEATVWFSPLSFDSTPAFVNGHSNPPEYKETRRRRWSSKRRKCLLFPIIFTTYTWSKKPEKNHSSKFKQFEKKQKSLHDAAPLVIGSFRNLSRAAAYTAQKHERRQGGGGIVARLRESEFNQQLTLFARPQNNWWLCYLLSKSLHAQNPFAPRCSNRTYPHQYASTNLK